MSGGFFRGTSADQDTRFSNKQAKLMKSKKFSPELDHLVDSTKVKMDVMRPWIANRVTGLIGFEDEVLINFIYGLLDGKKVNGKEVQISLTGFMEKNTGKFMKELWTLLLSAQKNASGVPQQFLDAKEEETRKKKAETDRIKNEIQRKKEEGREIEQEEIRKMEGEVDILGANYGALEPSSKHQLGTSSAHSFDEKESLRNGSRARSSKRRKSRSISESPQPREHSISSERVFNSPPRQSVTPRQKYSPQRSMSPSRRRSSHSRSISHSHRRSPSPKQCRLHSPLRRALRSPMRRRSLSPVRRRSRSLVPYRSQSPIQRRSRSPVHQRSPPLRRRSPSPLQLRSPSLLQNRSRSPELRRSPSPVRRRSPSPYRRRSPSLVRRWHRRYPSTPRRKSPSPVRRQYRRSPSTPRRRSPSPVRRGSPSPIRCRSPSPIRRRSHIPIHRKSSTTSRYRSPSPEELRFPSPVRSLYPSPGRKKSPKRRRRSPLQSPRERFRTLENSPVQHALPRENVDHSTEICKGPDSVVGRPPISLRSPQRDPRDRDDTRKKAPASSPSPYRSQSRSESPPSSRRRSPSEDRRSCSPYESRLKQTKELKIHDISATPPRKPRNQNPCHDSPDTRGEEEDTKHGRDNGDQKLKYSEKILAYSSTADKHKDSLERVHYTDDYSTERVDGRRSSETRSHPDGLEWRKKGQDIWSEKTSTGVLHPEVSDQQQLPTIHEDLSLSDSQRVLYPEEAYKADEKNQNRPNEVNVSKRRHEAETALKLTRKVDQNERSGSLISGSQESDKHHPEVHGKRKHKRSERKEGESDDSNDSDTEKRKASKRRRKKEKKLRKEERRRRREERWCRRQQRRAEKLKAKSICTVTSPSDYEKNHDGYDSDGERTVGMESEQKRLEIELRKKALESLRAKKGIGH